MVRKVYNLKTRELTERDITPEELAQMEAEAKRAEAEYWANILYDEAVNAEIRKQYTESQEFSLLRQKDEKPEEFAKYFAFCEECKEYVRVQMAKYSK